ncbi:hypothetical protein BT63DRAFT_459483 [Microthyrium microscopicum]|uniref:Uncharacterized protein n=1 Tax=Microthyrium microscopicum TaxID=703497 RepID=A0A6A6U0B3_9PEZI|nr:hypothetical protein BT63DRAFT_459483 [Microthyrium microscopicum]
MAAKKVFRKYRRAATPYMKEAFMSAEYRPRAHRQRKTSALKRQVVRDSDSQMVDTQTSAPIIAIRPTIPLNQATTNGLQPAAASKSNGRLTLAQAEQLFLPPNSVSLPPVNQDSNEQIPGSQNAAQDLPQTTGARPVVHASTSRSQAGPSRLTRIVSPTGRTFGRNVRDDFEVFVRALRGQQMNSSEIWNPELFLPRVCRFLAYCIKQMPRGKVENKLRFLQHKCGAFWCIVYSESRLKSHYGPSREVWDAIFNLCCQKVLKSEWSQMDRSKLDTIQGRINAICL